MESFVLNPVIHEVVDCELIKKGFTYQQLKTNFKGLYFQDISEYLDKICLNISKELDNGVGVLNLFINEEILYAEIFNGETLITSNCASIYETDYEHNVKSVLDEIESFIQDTLDYPCY